MKHGAIRNKAQSLRQEMVSSLALKNDLVVERLRGVGIAVACAVLQLMLVAATAEAQNQPAKEAARIACD